MSSLLVAAAFFVDVVGGRWGSYIATPIPGIFLPDALLAAATILAFFTWTRHVIPNHWVVWAFGPVLVYVVLFLLPEFGLVDPGRRYLALRDASPFLYLGIAPVLALGLRRISGRTAVLWLRLASGCLLVGSLVVTLGFVQPFSAIWLGTPFARVLEYRTDITGALLAAGIVSWQAIPAVGLRGSRIVQALYVVGAGICVESRSGLMTIAVAVVIVAISTRRLTQAIVLTFAGVLCFLLGNIVMDYTSSRGEDPASVTQSITLPPSSMMTNEGASLNSLARSGTVEARLRTWDLILSGLNRDKTWWVGGSAGSDYLYELCTGIKVAPQVVSAIREDPKCPVDDYGPSPLVRDPHNWLLNIVVTHGLLGLAVFVNCIGCVLWRGRRSTVYMQAAWVIGFLLISGLTFLISGGYALLPISVAMAWIVSRTGWREGPDGVDRKPVDQGDGAISIL